MPVVGIGIGVRNMLEMSQRQAHLPASKVQRMSNFLLGANHVKTKNPGSELKLIEDQRKFRVLLIPIFGLMSEKWVVGLLG